MKKGYSLLELIFTIVLIGVISGIGFYTYQPHTTFQDAQYTLLKLKQARYRSIGYDTLQSSGCVTLNENGLEESNETLPHEIKSSISHTARNDTLCFDSLGRPHDMGHTISLESLSHSPIDILFENRHNSDQNTRIRLFPQSGYAIIIPNNGS